MTGRAYSGAFDDLAKQTLLANGQPSFDLQFKRFIELTKRFQISYEPLVKPMLIYVGCDETQLVACKVLEYSIHKIPLVRRW